MVYNVKLVRYRHGTQVRIYSDICNKKELTDIYRTDYLDTKKANIDDDLDEYYSNFIFNPFTETEEYVSPIDDTAEKEDNSVTKRDRGCGSEHSIFASKSRTVNKIYDVTRANDWEYFLTLTFNPEKVDSFNYDEVSKKLSKWLNNFKARYAPDLKYIIVPELHKSGRYHFHGLLKDIGNMDLVDSGHLTKTGDTIFNLGNYKLGFSTVTRIKDVRKASGYITKYITKELCTNTFNKKRYWCSRNLDLPEVENLFCDSESKENLLCLMNNHILYEKTNETYGDFNMKVSYYELDCDIDFGGCCYYEKAAD